MLSICPNTRSICHLYSIDAISVTTSPDICHLPRHLNYLPDICHQCATTPAICYQYSTYLLCNCEQILLPTATPVEYYQRAATAPPYMIYYATTMRYQYAINTLPMNCDSIACHPQITAALHMVSIRYRYATNICYQYALNMLRLRGICFQYARTRHLLRICYECYGYATMCYHCALSI